MSFGRASYCLLSPLFSLPAVCARCMITIGIQKEATDMEIEDSHQYLRVWSVTIILISHLTALLRHTHPYPPHRVYSTELPILHPHQPYLTCLIYKSETELRFERNDVNTEDDRRLSTERTIMLALHSSMNVLAAARSGEIKALAGSLALDHCLHLEDWNALQYACAEADLHSVKALLSAGAQPDRRAQGHVVPGHTPLMISSRYGYTDIVASLLHAGADPDVQDNSGYTALHYCALHDRVDAAETLLRAGCDLSIQSKNDSTAFDLATFSGHSRMVKLLSKWAQTSTGQDIRLLQSWLDAIDCGPWFDRFIQAGYDFAFVAKHGLDDADLDCIGVPSSTLGLRRKLKALHRLGEFQVVEQGGNEDQVTAQEESMATSSGSEEAEGD